MAELAGEELEFFDGMIQRCIEEGASGKNINLRQEDISRVLLKAKEVFISQPSMLELASPIKILGDIHGCAPAPQPPRPPPLRPPLDWSPIGPFGEAETGLCRKRLPLPPLFAGSCSGPRCLRLAGLVRPRMTCSPHVSIERARAPRAPNSTLENLPEQNPLALHYPQHSRAPLRRCACALTCPAASPGNTPTCCASSSLAGTRRSPTTFSSAITSIEGSRASR